MSQSEYEKIEKLQWELYKEREKFSLFLQLNTNCFFEYDRESALVMFAKNETFSRLSGLVAELKEDIFIKETRIFYEDYPRLEELLMGSRDGEIEARFLGEEGDYRWCRVKTAIIEEKNGKNQVIGCINDDDNNHKKIAWLKEQSQLDPLTKFYNTQYMKEYTDLFFKTESKNKEGALFLIDIDDFKRINNNIGRLFGDTVLTNIAECIKHVFPMDSIIGRIGEDEFAVCVKNIEVAPIKTQIRNIDLELKKVYAGGKGDDLITACMGISRYPMDGDSYEELFLKAAASLYQAKLEGDGSVRVYDANLVNLMDKKRYGYPRAHFMDKEAENSKPTSAFCQKLTNYVQDLLDTTKDAYSAIQILLEKISKEYKADYVAIHEKVKGEKRLTKTYEFCKNGLNEQICLDESQNNFLKVKEEFSKNGLCVKSNTKYSYIQAAFYEEGKFKGMLSIGKSEPGVEWLEEEKEGIVSVARIISFHLFRLKLSEKIQERLDHMKNYDALTGMSTLHKFKVDALEKIQNENEKFAIIYSDIGNFKFINDLYGYQFGDRILYDFALAITKAMPENSLAGRVSADNFVALVPYTEKLNLEKRVLELGEAFHLIQKRKHIATNLVVITGVYLLKEGDYDISTALDNANVARKSAKTSSAAACIFYDEEMETKIKKEQEISFEMEDALKNREFLVYLQPKISLKEENLAGAEALVRWKRSNGEIIPPNDFIPLFEKNGFVVKLDFYVYEEVCKIIRQWMDKGITVTPISINVSRIHLNEDSFVEKIKDLVNRYSIPPKYIELELTESVFVNDTTNTIAVMKELRDYGFSVSIDDFGAGYSSLTLLKDMATDVIKLDKEFFSHGDMQKEEQIIVSSIIQMAKKLDMKVISEGIETRIQTDFLKDISCDMVQGYYYAKPMPLLEFEEFMQESQNKFEK
ncbi:MAG: bifunctional diguanylate cyclase/phosphodiesterase [Acetivibrio sp.]